MQEVRNWDQRKQKSFIQLNARLHNNLIVTKNRSNRLPNESSGSYINNPGPGHKGRHIN